MGLLAFKSSYCFMENAIFIMYMFSVVFISSVRIQCLGSLLKLAYLSILNL